MGSPPDVWRKVPRLKTSWRSPLHLGDKNRTGPPIAKAIMPPASTIGEESLRNTSTGLNPVLIVRRSGEGLMEPSPLGAHLA